MFIKLPHTLPLLFCLVIVYVCDVRYVYERKTLQTVEPVTHPPIHAVIQTNSRIRSRIGWRQTPHMQCLSTVLLIPKLCWLLQRGPRLMWCSEILDVLSTVVNLSLCYELDASFSQSLLMIRLAGVLWFI